MGYPKQILAMAVILCALGLAARAEGKYLAADEQVSRKIHAIMSGLEGIITNSPSGGDLIAERFFLVKKKLQKGEMVLGYDPKLDRSIVGGLGFQYDNENPKELPCISFGAYAFELFERHPTVVYSMLMYEIQLAYAYFQSHDHFVSTRKHKLEKFFYHMDALYIESLFIQKHLQAGGRKLTPYEKFLAGSLENDSLSSAAVVFMETDLELSHAMDDAKKLKGGLKEKMKALALIGEDILKTTGIDPDISDRNVRWANYQKAVKVSTYDKFVAQVAYDIAYSHNKLDPKDFSLDDYPGLKRAVQGVSELLEKNKSHLRYADDEIIPRFNDALK